MEKACVIRIVTLVWLERSSTSRAHRNSKDSWENFNVLWKYGLWVLRKICVARDISFKTEPRISMEN